MDDQSTDNTRNVIRNYIDSDSRFSLKLRPQDKPKGANACRNYGLEFAKGEYVLWMDSDDILHPECLTDILLCFENNSAEFCHFGRSVFWGDFKERFDKSPIKSFEVFKIDKKDIFSLLTNEIVFNTCNVIWNRNSIGQERFSEEIVYADEWEFYSRLLANGLFGISVGKVLLFGRKHKNSTTSEFYNYDFNRRKSKIKAAQLVIDHLASKGLLTRKIIRFFIGLSYFLKSSAVSTHLFRYLRSNPFNWLFYKVYYLFLPLLLTAHRYGKVMRKNGGLS